MSNSSSVGIVIIDFEYTGKNEDILLVGIIASYTYLIKINLNRIVSSGVTRKRWRWRKNGNRSKNNIKK